MFSCTIRLMRMWHTGRGRRPSSRRVYNHVGVAGTGHSRTGRRERSNMCLLVARKVSRCEWVFLRKVVPSAILFTIIRLHVLIIMCYHHTTVFVWLFVRGCWWHPQRLCVYILSPVGVCSLPHRDISVPPDALPLLCNICYWKLIK